MKKYTPPSFLFNGHLETIYPTLVRMVTTPVPYERERIETPDHDFLDLDWMRHAVSATSGGSLPSLTIISHGLEGNSHRAYMKGMAKAFYDRGTDVLAWNFRSCGGAMNNTTRFYHSGDSGDLATVITHALAQDIYACIYLVGFSLGGNITLKYLGERGALIPPKIKKAVVFSVPMDLQAGAEKISNPRNWLYSKRFLISLKNKVKAKAMREKSIDVTDIDAINDLVAFDNRYTAPLHGFENAVDYYTRSSSLRFVTHITIPTLIVNAKNDPFLTPECYPVSLLKDHPCVTLEMPERGGHVGFTLFNSNGLYWSELRALEFIHP